MTDFLDEKHREITDRLAELQPLVEEYQRLEAAVAALDGLGRSAAAPAASARKAAAKAAPKAAAKKPPVAVDRAGRAARKPKPKSSCRPGDSDSGAAPAGRGGARRKAGRRKGSGTRAAQALAFVQEQAGITIPELAARMGIKQNYLYRVLPILEEEGKVRKQGRGWHPRR